MHYTFFKKHLSSRCYFKDVSNFCMEPEERSIENVNLNLPLKVGIFLSNKKNRTVNSSHHITASARPYLANRKQRFIWVDYSTVKMHLLSVKLMSTTRRPQTIAWESFWFHLCVSVMKSAWCQFAVLNEDMLILMSVEIYWLKETNYTWGNMLLYKNVSNTRVTGYSGSLPSQKTSLRMHISNHLKSVTEIKQ